MPQNIYWISAAQPYRLAIVARPRGHDWLADEIEGLAREGIDILVSMLTPEEATELGLMEEERLCVERGIKFLNFPIPDRSVPNGNEIRVMLNELANAVKLGKGIGVHCRAGIGRSSMMAALVLTRLGWSPQAAFQAISESRGCKVPDTPEQEQWVTRFVRE